MEREQLLLEEEMVIQSIAYFVYLEKKKWAKREHTTYVDAGCMRL
jgi:hypothetical protein